MEEVRRWEGKWHHIPVAGFWQRVSGAPVVGVAGSGSSCRIEAEGVAPCESFLEAVAIEIVPCRGVKDVSTQDLLMAEDGAVLVDTGGDGSSSAGPEVEGGQEGGDGDSEGVLDESRGNRQDVEVCEYEMEVARICSGENGEY